MEGRSLPKLLVRWFRISVHGAMHARDLLRERRATRRQGLLLDCGRRAAPLLSHNCSAFLQGRLRKHTRARRRVAVSGGPVPVARMRENRRGRSSQGSSLHRLPKVSREFSGNCPGSGPVLSPLPGGGMRRGRHATPGGHTLELDHLSVLRRFVRAAGRQRTYCLQQPVLPSCAQTVSQGHGRLG